MTESLETDSSSAATLDFLFAFYALFATIFSTKIVSLLLVPSKKSLRFVLRSIQGAGAQRLFVFLVLHLAVGLHRTSVCSVYSVVVFEYGQRHD